jgi:DNA-binding response OmpR family regulator
VGEFPFEASCPLQVDPRLKIDFPARKLFWENVSSSLTPTEARLLYILMRYSGETVETDFLLRRMWPREIIYEDRLHVYVHRLRSKLKEAGGRHQYVILERGVGYRFQPRPEADY